MNIIIVGCGNVGFETAKLLSKEHRLLLLDLYKPDHVTEFLKDKKDVQFAQVDATNVEQMEKAVDTFAEQNHGIDALVSTIGAIVPGTPIDNFEVFKKNFELNFFGNLIPVKCAIKHMIAARSGRIIIMSSTTGHHSPKSMAAYAPAKWAIECLSNTMRSELRPYGITVDVLSPASIKNRYSKTFISHFEILEAADIAARIESYIRKPKNSDHFIPARYRMLHLAERLAPEFLDRSSGLQWSISRGKKFKDIKINTVLIVGASSDIGGKLALLYAKTVKKVYMIGENYETMQETRYATEATSTCEVYATALDMADLPSIKEYVDKIKDVDLLINASGQSVTGSVNDTPVERYRQDFNTNFFGVLYLLGELFKKDNKPKKIINILSLTALAGKRDHSSYACTKAALWAITRSMRRMYGNSLQVTEVFSSENSPALHAIKAGQEHFDTAYGDSALKAVARDIYGAEKKGKEKVVSVKAKCLLVFEALTPGLYNMIYT